MSGQREDFLYDVVIVGGGPAGLTAAIYLARACYRVLVVEKEKFGGQITITSEVVNYPGVERTNGTELTNNMRKQAQSFGAEFLLAEVEKLELSGDMKKVITSRGEYKCFGVLMASGAHPRTIGFKGEEEFKGHGVAYCATCDGEFFTGKEVFVIGGGFAAAEESVFLTKYAAHVTILIREDDFTCAKAVADEARNHDKITVITNVVVEEVSGTSMLNHIKYRNTQTNEVIGYSSEDGFGVFVFAGYEPATALVKDIAELNEQGYIITDRNQKTSVDGLYAAGDVCVKSLRQVVTAVGDGALAATELERYAAAMQTKTGLHPEMKKTKAGIEKPAENNAGQSEKINTNEESLFNDDMLAQLRTIFERMQKPLLLKLYLDERPVSAELEHYMRELAGLTEMLTLTIETDNNAESVKTPCVKICYQDGLETGLAFHGVPGGHEFTSFVLGLYNAAGPGQVLDEDVKKQIQSIERPIDLKIMVSLTCTMCPELVTSAQRIAVENDMIKAEVYDLNHFQDLKEKYQVMSVPCMVVNEEKPVFGKKNVKQLMDIIMGAGD